MRRSITIAIALTAKTFLHHRHLLAKGNPLSHGLRAFSVGSNYRERLRSELHSIKLHDAVDLWWSGITNLTL
ncbi:BnaC08g44840D [Brassica napus]|uniref:BnaC08g44840D protein n=1 Tax=Brassica napus TaxID=3708 RepID=A0A078FAB0_BRANA|nr:BnaC08g44840D [Brassica napus]